MPVVDIDTITKSQNVPEKVLETYKLLHRYMSHEKRKKWLEKKRQNRKLIDDHEIWSDDEIKQINKQKQIPLVIDKCGKGVQGSTAIVTDAKPEVKMLPIGNTDLYVAELLKRGFNTVWEKSEGNDMHYEYVRNAKIDNLAVIYIRYDKSLGLAGRIVFEEDDIEDYYFDPYARKTDYSDTPIIRAKRRTKEYILEHYDDVTDDDLDFAKSLKEEAQGEKSEGITGGDNYAEAEKTGKNEQKRSAHEPPKDIWEIEFWDLKSEREFRLITVENGEPKLIETYESKKDAEEGKRENKDSEIVDVRVQKRVKRVIVGKKQIEEDEKNPYGTDNDGVPILPCIFLAHDKTSSAYPTGPVSRSIPLNKELCKARMQYHHTLSHNNNAPWIEPKDKVTWIGTPGTPGSRAKVDPNAPWKPYREQAGQVHLTAIIQRENLAREDIDAEFDLHDVMRGKIPSGQTNIAGRTVVALQEFGGVMQRPFLRKDESALTRLGKAVASLMLQYWTEDRWRRLIEPDELKTWEPDTGKEKEEGYQPDSELITKRWEDAVKKVMAENTDSVERIGIVDIDVKVTAGSGLPTNRIAKYNLALDMKHEGVYDAEAVLKYVDDVNKDEIIERIKKREQMEMEQALMKG